MGVNGIYGLSGSGLDIESLVKMGMSGKNKQYDKMEQQEIANTWLKEAYNDVYNDMLVYKYDTLSTYKMQSNMNAMQASSSNSGVVTATANGAAAAMNHTVEVTSVASNAYLQTAQKDSAGNPFPADDTGVKRANTAAKTSNKLLDVMFSSYGPGEEDGTYKVNGSTVNGSDIAVSLKLKDTDGDNAKEYTLTYTYDELFEGEKTLNDLASAFAKTGANIQGGYDTANDSFSLYNKTSGKSNIIDITVQNDNTATLFNNLRLGVVKDNTLSNAIKFETPTAMPTTMESVDLTSSITSSSQSVSMKDVLGLSATSVDNGDGSYTVTVKDHSGSELGTFTKNADGSYTGKDETAFAMNLSNGTDSTTVSFTLGELFNLNDIGSKSSLGGNAGLDELASKINATGLGITAKYDAIADSFSLNNPSGQANLTAVSGTGEAIADRLKNSLNLENSDSIKCVAITNDESLASVFGFTTSLRNDGGGSFTLSVTAAGSTLVNSQSGSRTDFTTDDGRVGKKTDELFSFKLNDGSNEKTIKITFGDIVDYTAFTATGDSKITVADGGEIKAGKSAVARNPSKDTNNLGIIAQKINDAGLNIKASYDEGTGKLSVYNPAGGAIKINDVALEGETESLSVYGMTLGKATPDNITYKTSTSITRVNATSSDDSLAAAVGLTAVKNTDGSLTVKKSDGNIEKVDTANIATTAALTFKVGNGTSEKEVSLTYADLFDTTGSGTLKGTADFSTLVAKINGAGAGVTAAYDSATGKFSLTNAAGDATLTGVDSLASTLVSKMGLTESEETKAAKEAAGQLHQWAGTNATVTIDGKSYDNDTNKLTVDGVTYNFLETTEDVVGKKVTISVSQDTDKIVDYVKSFVDDYNKLLDSLNEKLSEQKYSDYKPLSKRQEDEMTEKQIDKWNEKAKSGILYHNSDIQALVSAMREAIYTKVDAVDSEYNTMSSIGITTTNTKGHLTLDTDKLKKALAADPDCVYQLFASDQDSTYIAGTTNKNKITTAQSKLDYANTGVANRLYNVMTNHMSKISDIAGTSKETDDQSYLGKLITNMQTKMKNFKTMMTAYENKLYKRYDAMEVALSRLNMQLGYISGSFS